MYFLSSYLLQVKFSISKNFSVSLGLSQTSKFSRNEPNSNLNQRNLNF